MNYNEILSEYKYRICNDNIIRDYKGHPKCCNEIYQHLLEKIQDGHKLDMFEDKLYGCCILSLVEIVLNNKMMRWQTEEIKDECRTEMYVAILEATPRYFDRNRGSTAYSYSFRIGYTTCVHVLERHNAERKMIEKLLNAYEDFLMLHTGGKAETLTNLE